MNDCRFCYCPLYPCYKTYRGGKIIKNQSGKEIWDCSGCDIIHNLRVAERLDKFINRNSK